MEVACRFNVVFELIKHDNMIVSKIIFFTLKVTPAPFMRKHEGAICFRELEAGIYLLLSK